MRLRPLPHQLGDSPHRKQEKGIFPPRPEPEPGALKLSESRNGGGCLQQGDVTADPQEGTWDQGSVLPAGTEPGAGPLSRLCLHVSLGTMSTFLNLRKQTDQIVREALSDPDKGHSTEVLFNLTAGGDGRPRQCGEACRGGRGSDRERDGWALSRLDALNSLVGNPHSPRGALRRLDQERNGDLPPSVLQFTPDWGQDRILRLHN